MLDSLISQSTMTSAILQPTFSLANSESSNDEQTSKVSGSLPLDGVVQPHSNGMPFVTNTRGVNFASFNRGPSQLCRASGVGHHQLSNFPTSSSPRGTGAALLESRLRAPREESAESDSKILSLSGSLLEAASNSSARYLQSSYSLTNQQQHAQFRDDLAKRKNVVLA